jgi:hypothetical protein
MRLLLCLPRLLCAPTTSYRAGAMGTCIWRAADVVGTSRWWILAASIVDSTLAVGPEHLDAFDAVGICSWWIADAMETSSNWRADVTMGVVGGTPVTSALVSSGMSPI